MIVHLNKATEQHDRHLENNTHTTWTRKYNALSVHEVVQHRELKALVAFLLPELSMIVHLNKATEQHDRYLENNTHTTWTRKYNALSVHCVSKK